MNEPPPNPFAPPSVAGSSRIQSSDADPKMLRAVGMAQRLVLKVLLLAIVIYLLTGAYRPLRPYAWVILLVVPLHLYAIVQLARALRLSAVVTIFFAVLAFVPVVGLFSLFLINGMATKVLRRANIPVGFMGARESDLPRG